MAQSNPPEDLMHYHAMAQDALRGVVKAALKRAASPEGLPGAHHLYITFKTHARGVSAPPDLIARYPDEMMIVLQNQFWDLAPGETFFSVTLKFGGEPKQLEIPYSAVTRFVDPSVQFGLEFEAPADLTPPAEKPAEATATADGSEEPKVVSLDQFRKK
jgi:hypothetical protein